MKFTLGLLLGAAAGAAVVHYLNTTEGKLLVNKVKRDADNISDNISDLADGLVEKGRSLVGGGKDAMEDQFADETVVVVVGS